MSPWRRSFYIVATVLGVSSIVSNALEGDWMASTFAMAWTGVLIPFWRRDELRAGSETTDAEAQAQADHEA